MPALAELADLPENSVEMAGLLLGPTTLVMVQDVVFDAPEIIKVDKQQPRADGIRFGRDQRGGRLITLTMHVFADGGGAQAVAMLGRMETAWLADDVRSVPGAVCSLRFRTGGRTLRVYGRPRRFAAISLRANANGWAPVTADFQASDHLYYSDQEHSNTVSIVPPAAGGFFTPFVFPLTSLGVSYSPGVITIGGDAPTWPVFLIRGPITDPVVRVVDNWSLSFTGITLAKDETLAIDSRPWSRGVRRNVISSVAGALTAGSPRLSQVALPPSTYEIVLAGTDPTGTSSMTVAWREVFHNF